jgi:two-component system cell cycle sensor histidine kinase/response regulator CckA
MTVEGFAWESALVFHRARGRGPTWFDWRPGTVLALASVLFGAIYGLQFIDQPVVGEPYVLFVLPIALCAVRFEVRGGIAAGAVGLGLMASSEVFNQPTLDPADYLPLIAAFLLLGALLGHSVRQRRRLEEKLNRYHDLSLDLLCTANTDGYFTRLNPTWEQTLGYGEAELMSRPFVDFVHPDDRVDTERETAKLARGDITVNFRNRYRTRDGSYRWLEWNACADTSEQIIYATARDISDKKQAEEALAHHNELLETTVREEAAQALGESEERFRLIAEHARDLIALLDREGRFLYLSPSWESALGYPAGALLGTVALELIHPDDWPEGAKLGEGKLRELRHRKADGGWLWVEGLSYSVAGRLTASRFAVIARDISERRRADDRLHDLFENANDLISTSDLDWRLTSANGAFARRSGYARPELIGMKFDQLYTADSVSRAREMRRRKLEGETRATTYEMEMVAKDGGSVPIEVSTRLIVEGGKPVGTHSIGRDLSERKLLEEELRQAQKMEAVGQLAGGIAHDFNNLLTVISGYTEILLRRLGREGEESKEVVEINKAAERAAQLTGQLLAYSRKQLLKPRALDLNNVVTETQTMLKRLIGENIEFSTTLAEDLGSISADEGQIEQIIMNLVVNARDAMPEGGTLLLETSNFALADVSTSRRPDIAPGDYVVLTLADSGQGMEAATVARIFEPFYTTKARGVGTGLGLATVYGIVKQSGGYIELESEPGIGTTFRLYFPQVAEEAEAVVPTLPDERPLMGSETVLLVEDEEALRGVGRRMLEMYGYTVLLAADGAAGLELAQNYPHPIQLLMTDILMPKMGGIELAERLSALRPEMKILYTSGYNDSGGNLQTIEGARYLQKPYAMEELAHTLRELLDPAHPPGYCSPVQPTVDRHSVCGRSA